MTPKPKTQFALGPRNHPRFESGTRSKPKPLKVGRNPCGEASTTTKEPVGRTIRGTRSKGMPAASEARLRTTHFNSLKRLPVALDA